MAFDLIQIKDDGFPKTTTVAGDGNEYIVVSKSDGITYGILTSDFKDFLGTVTTVSPKPITPSDPAPTLDGVYLPSAAGTYANMGGLIYDPAGVDAGKYVEFIKNGTDYVKRATDLPQVDTSLLVAKSDVESYNLIDAEYWLYDAIINSAGNPNTTNREGAICVVNQPLPVGTFTIGGFQVMTGFKYFAIKDSEGNVRAGSNIQLTSLPYTFTTDATYRYISFTFKNPTATEPDNSGWEGTLGISEGSELGVGVTGILGQPLSAMSLLPGNTVPDPIDDENAVNKRHLDLVAITEADMEFQNSDVNLAWPSRARDGIFIAVDGQKVSAPGWRLFRIPVSGMAYITVSGFTISDSGYSSFWDNTEIDGQVGTTGMILNNGGFNTAGLPLTLPVPAGAEYLLIDVKRPANSLEDSELLMINEGQSALPYTPAATVTKIKGYALAAGGGGEAYDQSLNTTDSVQFEGVSTDVLNAMSWIIENGTVWDETGTAPIGAEFVYLFPDGNGRYFLKVNG